MSEFSLRRQIASYLDYYHDSRRHLSLGKGFPDGRAVEPPALGRVVAYPRSVAFVVIDTSEEPPESPGARGRPPPNICAGMRPAAKAGPSSARFRHLYITDSES
jgi:hypothetical protein